MLLPLHEVYYARDSNDTFAFLFIFGLIYWISYWLGIIGALPHPTGEEDERMLTDDELT